MDPMLSIQEASKPRGKGAAYVFPALAMAFAAATTPLCAEGAEVRGPRLPGIRPLGMGDSFVAVCDDRNALHYNPAGLSQVKRWSVSGIGVYGGVDEQFLDVVSFIQDNEDKFSDVDLIDQEFIDSLAPFDDRWVATDASVYMDFTKKSFGIGAFSTGRLQFKIDRGVYEPRVDFNVADDIVGLAGASLDLGRMNLQVGAAAKGIWRRESTRTLTARELADFDPVDLLDELEVANAGFGLDLGTMWNPVDSHVAAGAVFRNLGVVAGEPMDAELDLGTSVRLFEGRGALRGVLLAADLSNVLASEEAWGNRMHLGAEIRIPVLSLRGGFNQGYPSVGASLNARVITLDYAYFGRELGEFPGAEAQYLHAVEAKIGF